MEGKRDGHRNRFAHAWPITVHREWMDSNGLSDLVSVVLPTYNRAHLLENALGSVRSQTYRPIEIVVADDGSCDDTDEVIDVWKEKISKDDELDIRYFYQPNRGTSAARNLALIHSRGEYLQFLDSDDVLHPQKIEIHASALQSHPELDHVYSGLHSESDNPSYPFDVCFSVRKMINSIQKRSHSPGAVHTGFYRRSACYRVGPFDESLKNWNDREYNLRFDLLGLKTAEIEVDLYKMTSHDSARLTDTSETVKGVESRLYSLESMINTIRSFGRDPRRWDTPNIGNIYFKLSRPVLDSRRDDLLEKIIYGIDKYKSSQLESILLNTFIKLLGPRNTLKIVLFYSFARRFIC